MFFVANAQKYSPFGTPLPPCQVTPFSSSVGGMNIGGIGILASSVIAVRIVGARINNTEHFFPTPVLVIDRLVNGIAGTYSNASELVGNAMRTLYSSVFSMSKIPFLFTIGWDVVLSKNYTAHAIDNSTITNHNNANAYMIYQFRDINGIWGSNYGNGTYNVLSTTSLAIESDIDPLMRCSLNNITNIEIKSLYTSQPDIILSGIPMNPNNINILLTYISYLSYAQIDQLFYPVLQLGAATGCSIDNFDTVNMSAGTKAQLQALGWAVNF